MSHTCLICGASDLRAVATNRNFGINIVQCDVCDFVQSEFVSDKALEAYYQGIYRGKLSEAELAAHREKGAAQAKGQIAYLLEQHPWLKVEKALDYGAAEGSLGHALRAIADKVCVTEMDQQFVALLRSDPLLTLVDREHLTSGAFCSFFDLACISHVLEHLTNPYQALDIFAFVLKPGGLLLVDVPNELRLLQYGFQARGHLSYFTKGSLAQLIDVHGCFDIMEIRTCNREVDAFINSGFRSPEEYGIPLANDGTTIRALLRRRPVYSQRRCRSHTFDHAAILNEYSARILHLYNALAVAQERVAQLQQAKPE